MSLSAFLGRPPYPTANFVVKETENKPEELIGGNIYSDEIMAKLTEEFKNDEICDSKINLRLANAVNKVWDKNILLFLFLLLFLTYYFSSEYKAVYGLIFRRKITTEDRQQN